MYVVTQDMSLVIIAQDESDTENIGTDMYYKSG